MSEDSRVTYTRNALQQALLKLMKSKHIEKITVKELCEQAGINRGTFYLHYNNPAELLLEIEQTFMRDNYSYMLECWNFFPQNNSYLPGFFEFLKENRDFLMAFFGSNNNSFFFESITEKIRPEIISLWKQEFPTCKKDHLEFLYVFLLNGIRSLIAQWAKDPESIAPEVFVHRMEMLGHHCLLAAKEFK